MLSCRASGANLGIRALWPCVALRRSGKGKKTERKQSNTSCCLGILDSQALPLRTSHGAFSPLFHLTARCRSSSGSWYRCFAVQSAP
jgi:hypothetical protein